MLVSKKGRALAFVASVIVIAAAFACNRDVQASAKDEKGSNGSANPSVASAAVQRPAALVPIRAPGRVVAIGDLHGDLAVARRALQIGRVLDEADHWIGGNSVVVQTGDILDRGDEERPLLEWFERLAGIAKDGGGAVYRVQGNHEVMNVAGDLRYISEKGFLDFAEYAEGANSRPLGNVPAIQRGRLAAFLPGGPWARRLAAYPAVLIVNDSVFAHGGLVPKHLSYGLERINSELAAWMRGTGRLGPLLAGDEAPYWDRTYGDSVTDADCRMLDGVLAELSVKRLVVGHTPQKSGITFACDKHVARIDVGLSRFYGSSRPAVLEVAGDQLNVLTETSSNERAARRKPAKSASAHP